MKKYVFGFIAFFIILVVMRYMSLGFIIWYEIIGGIGLICFMACSFIIGYFTGQAKIYDNKTNKLDIIKRIKI